MIIEGIILKVLLCLFLNSTAARSRESETLPTCPDYKLRVPAYSRLVDVLPSALQNRTILFIGDSTMMHQFINFVKFAQCDTSSVRKLNHLNDFHINRPPKRTLLANGKDYQHNSKSIQSSRYSKPKPVIPRMPEPSSYSSKWLNLTIEFWPYGRLSTYHATEQARYREWLSLRVSQASSNDIIIMNLGIHWDFKKTVSDFKEALEYFFKLMGWGEEVSRHCESAHGDRKNHFDNNNKPIVMWRETIPQHFNTSNGHYPGDGASGVYTQCAPATIARSAGKAFGSACIPNCLPTNWHNDVANKLVHRLSSCGVNINLIHLWEELICLHGSHKGITTGDCAHLLNDEKTNALLHWKLLLALLPQVDVPIPSSWNPPSIDRNTNFESHKSSVDAEDGFFSYY